MHIKWFSSAFCVVQVNWSKGHGEGVNQGFRVFQVGREGKGQSQQRELQVGVGSVPSPLFEKCSVHSKAQHGAHGGADACSQPESGVLQVRLSHVPVTDRRRWRARDGK